MFSDHGTLSFVVPNEYKIAKKYDLHSISNVCYDVNSTVRRQKMARKKCLQLMSKLWYIVTPVARA
ncbi:hypothetical protein ACFQZT_32870, partial [Paenibacillus sp. GCM10027628]|uniref:hypothetical protein n=1 Tax=Paenibacillus sp. GCM10027628 TaxID=3273413 RepID=UPI003631ED79